MVFFTILVRYNGNEIDTRKDNYDITTQVYIQYGISDKLETTVVLPYKFVGYKNKSSIISQSLSGISNVTFGLKYAISKKKLRTSISLHYITSTYNKNDIDDLHTGFEVTIWLPYFAIGSSSNNWYYFGNIGYGYMTNNYSDYLKVGGEVGHSIFKIVSSWLIAC